MYESLHVAVGAAIKMTHNLKCAYSVTPANFCAKFCALVSQGSVH